MIIEKLESRLEHLNEIFTKIKDLDYPDDGTHELLTYTAGRIRGVLDAYELEAYDAVQE